MSDLNSEYDAIINKLRQSPVQQVDQEVLDHFYMPGHRIIDKFLYEVSGLTDDDQVVLRDILKKHHWNQFDYLAASNIEWRLE